MCVVCTVYAVCMYPYPKHSRKCNVSKEKFAAFKVSNRFEKDEPQIHYYFQRDAICKCLIRCKNERNVAIENNVR